MIPDTTTWTLIGKSENAEFFEIEPQILAVVPNDGSTDDTKTAKESIRIQLEHLRKSGGRAATIVFMDRVVAQDTGARTVYRDDPDPAFQVCFALVGGTPFGRAVGSVFIGLHPPRIPTKMFATVEDATAWIRTKLSP